MAYKSNYPHPDAISSLRASSRRLQTGPLDSQHHQQQQSQPPFQLAPLLQQHWQQQHSQHTPPTFQHLHINNEFDLTEPLGGGGLSIAHSGRHGYDSHAGDTNAKAPVVRSSPPPISAAKPERIDHKVVEPKLQQESNYYTDPFVIDNSNGNSASNNNNIWNSLLTATDETSEDRLFDTNNDSMPTYLDYGVGSPMSSSGNKNNNNSNISGDNDYDAAGDWISKTVATGQESWKPKSSQFTLS
ncbi:hypothetical protein BGZ65_006362, partial [Modicella reniformis]